MSLIKKIVEIVERSDMVDAKKHINKLNKEIKDHKEKVRSLMEANYNDFMPEIVSNETLLEEGSILENDVINLKENLNNESTNMLKSASEEVSRLTEELNENQLALITSLKLVKIDYLLHKIKPYNEAKNFKLVNNLLNDIQLLIGDPDDKIIRRLEIYKNLKVKLTVERETMMKNLIGQFESLVQTKQKTFPKNQSITFIISKNSQELVECIHTLLECDYDFQKFVDFCVNNIFQPIASRAVSLDIKENDKEVTMILMYSIEPVSDELRPNYEIVFLNLRSVLFLMRHMNVQVQDNYHFLAYLFNDFKPKIFDLIFNECLKYNIPKTYDEKNHSTINADIGKLCRNFTELNFFDSVDDKDVEAFCNKIDDLFFEQFTKNVQSSANEILKRDLHDMIHISDDATLSTTTPLTFPKSMISKSTLELIKLLEKIIRQASSCSVEDEQKKTNLLNSIKAVLDNYSFTIQLHHSNLLSKIPQQSALFFNNCMYLCNWIALNDEFEGFNIDVIINDLKRQGEEFFECQVVKQKIQLLEILKEFDPYQSLNNFQQEHFKPIRQALRQMDLLKNVWQTILPSDLYNKTIGNLLDVIAIDIIKKVLRLEDISTTLANGLVEMIKNFEEKGQLLFEADCSALNFVTNWKKLINLQFILDASLVDIQASWKNNQISASFKAEEVKHLIRALFQNTERRANCLQNII
ncbi:centromere/kinetochore protein zw10 [Chironomus tepperi]|uniref:centromere/kinetochore protein zw10 n=1 Tax=Chironomus tepperi TaxID=113505 RepID=UPI00391F7804